MVMPRVGVTRWLPATFEVLKEVLAGVAAIFRGLRISRDEIGRRQRINELAGIEIDLASRGLVHAFDFADCRKNRPRRDKIAIFYKVEDSILAPLRMLEPLISWGIGFACTRQE